MNDLYNLIKRLGALRKYIFLLILRSPFDALRAWMMACLMKSTFRCIETGNLEKLLLECIIYGLICGGLFFYNGTIWSIYVAFAAEVEVKLQKMMLYKMMNTSLEKIEGCFSSQWITRLNSDVHGAFVLLNGSFNIPHAVVSAINLTLSSVLLCRSSVWLFLVTWGFILPHLLLNRKVVLKRLPGLKEDSQNALSECTSAIIPLITEIDTILIYDAGNLMMNICENSSRKLMKINVNMHMRNAFSSAVLQVLGLGGYLVIMLLGFKSIYKGTMSFADITFLFQLRGSLMAAVLMLIMCVNNMKANSVCVKRINNTFNE